MNLVTGIPPYSPTERAVQCAVTEIPGSPSRINLRISNRDLVLLSRDEAIALCRHLAVAVGDLCGRK